MVQFVVKVVTGGLLVGCQFLVWEVTCYFGRVSIFICRLEK